VALEEPVTAEYFLSNTIQHMWR